MTIAETVAGGDLDALVRLVDGLCSSRDWPGVVELRDRCQHALERGLQLWPAAEYAEYRLALHAPAEFAGPVVVDDAGRFALGPLWEVAASTHPWSEIAGHIPPGPARAMAAHERVLRGEDLTGEGSVDGMILEIPLRLEAFEPRYETAVFRSDEADFPSPAPPSLDLVDLPGPVHATDESEGVEALLELGRTWAEQSNGEVTAVAVAGVALQAVAAMGVTACRASPLSGAEAMAWMAWAGASGGAYGRRRGGPAGRFAAWWAVAALAGLDWPTPADEVAAALDDLEWWLWEPDDAVAGWSLRLAVADPTDGLAWALNAFDSFKDEDQLE